MVRVASDFGGEKGSAMAGAVASSANRPQDIDRRQSAAVFFTDIGLIPSLMHPRLSDWIRFARGPPHRPAQSRASVAYITAFPRRSHENLKKRTTHKEKAQDGARASLRNSVWRT